MAKINSIKLDGVTRYIETIAYKDSLPTATSDSADLVSINNKIFVKNNTTTQGVSGIWQFKDDPTTNLTVAKNITFTTTSDGATIYTQIIGGSSDMWYDDTYVYDSADWSNADYKTVAIIGGADIEDSELESFLTTNATYLGRAYYYTELTAGSDEGLTEEEVTNLINSNETVVTLTSDVRDLQTDKQDKLVSGSNIKTINNETILGSGNIEIGAGAPITIADSLPAATEETFEEGKIYTTGVLLQYISKELSDTPSIGQVNLLPQALTRTSAASVGTDIYIFGGYDSSGEQNTIYKYSITANTTTIMSATLPRALANTSAAAVGTDVYIFGGFNGINNMGRQKIIYKYDTTTDTISTMSTTLPTTLEYSSAATVGTDIYIFGGFKSGNDFTNTIYKYSTGANTITTMSTTLPQALSDTSAAAVGRDIYIFGGRGSSYSNTIYKFDTTINTITTMSATFPVALHATSAAAFGSDIYVFGGEDRSYNYLNTIYKYDTTTDTLIAMSTTLPVALRYSAAAAVGTDAYIFGGSIGDYTYVKTIYRFSLGFNYQYEEVATKEALENKQDLLESGINIKTINNESILGSGNINVGDAKIDSSSTFSDGQVVVVSDGGNKLIEGTNIKTINGESILGSGNIEVAGDTTYVENGTLIINEGTTTGGGTEVVANNGETTTDTLSSLKVGEINYAVPSGGLTEEEVQTLINNAIGTTLQGGY